MNFEESIEATELTAEIAKPNPILIAFPYLTESITYPYARDLIFRIEWG